MGVKLPKFARFSIGSGGGMLFGEGGNCIYYSDARKVLEEIDLLAEAGLCSMSLGGKHAYLHDIRSVIAKLGIQGGLTKHE